MRTPYCALALLFVLGYARAEDERIARVHGQGLVRGLRVPEDEYFAFRAIPYANASDPINRFKFPLPTPTWNGIHEGIDGIECTQLSQRGVVGTDDCLVLNVYAPAIATPSQPVPVMLFIHGGGFNTGSSSASVFGPRHFVTRGVVLVTINYRLGIHGFLCTPDNPGNAGLKDIVAALRWVQKNIAEFGGNPKNVTIFGQSAGGAAVELMMLSPMARGLFHRAISQSGSAFMPWAITTDPINKVQLIGNALGFNTSNITELVNKLRKIDTKKLAEATVVLFEISLTVQISPCIEFDTKYADTFLSESPYSMMQSSNYKAVPYMSGYNKEDGLIFLSYAKLFQNYYEIVDKEFWRILPNNLHFTSDADKRATAKDMKELYFENRQVKESINTFVEYATDAVYLFNLERSLNSHLRHGKEVYFYEFAYDGSLPFLKKRMGVTNMSGVCHADELGYQFTQDEAGSPNANDSFIIKTINDMWTNFAKYGKPILTSSTLPNWRPMNTKEMNYFHINVECKEKFRPHKEREEHWYKLYATKGEEAGSSPLLQNNAAMFKSIRLIVLYIIPVVMPWLNVIMRDK